MAEIIFTNSDFSDTPQTNKPKTDAPKADFAASLHGLNYNLDVLRQKLDPSVELELRPKSEYRNTAAFKDLSEEQFNTWYKGVETAFNVFEQNKDMSLDNPFIKTLFDTPYTRALQATDPRVKIGANIKQELDFNPFAITQGMASKDQFHQDKSVHEAAQLNTRIKDSKTGHWVDEGEPVGNLGTYLNYLPRGLMIATDTNGIPKLDNFGRPYYETIDGRDTTGKDHLLAKTDNFLTQEGSFFNAIDPFDSDQIEKNTARSIIKNTLKVGSYFLPYGIGSAIAGTTALLNMGEMFSEGWKTFNALGNKLSGGEYKVDEDVERRANTIANITRSLSWGSQTEEEQKNPWSIASLSNLLADGVGQIRTQRFIAQAPIFGRALADPNFRKALEAGDKSAQTYINASKNLARAYMTGQAAMEVGEAFEQAGLDKGTKDLAMGAAALAFGALYKTAPFDWMLDGVGVNAVQKATKKVIEKEIKDLAGAMAAESSKKALTEVEKKAILAKGLTNIQNKVKDFMANTNFAETLKGAGSEAAEEAMETIIGDGIKLGFQLLGKNNLIKADKDALKRLDPFGENFLEDLALSAVAGGMSGGVVGASQDLQLRKQARDINSLADISQNGYTDYALNELENLRSLGKKGKGLVSDKLSTEIEGMENGIPIYKPMSEGTSLTSQNDYVINTVKQQLLSTHFALQSIGADKEGLEEKLKTANELFKSVYTDAKNSSLLEDAKQISRDLIATRAEIDELTKQAEIKKINQTGDKFIDEELKLKLAPLQKKAEQLQKRYDELAKIGKEKSELAEDYLRESLYKANPFAWAGFDIKSKSDFTQGKVGEELNQAEKEWEEYRLTKRNVDIKKAYNEAKDIFENDPLFKQVKDPNVNISNLLANQKVEELLDYASTLKEQKDTKKLAEVQAILDKITDNPDFIPTEDVLARLKQSWGEEELDSSNYQSKFAAPYISDDFFLLTDEDGFEAPFDDKVIDAAEKATDLNEFLSYFDYDGQPMGLFINNANGEYTDVLKEEMTNLYEQVKSYVTSPHFKIDEKLRQTNKKSSPASKIRLVDIEKLIKTEREEFLNNPTGYRDDNPKDDSSRTKKLEAAINRLNKLRSTLHLPYKINVFVNIAKQKNKDKFANPEPEFQFENDDQFNYLNRYLINLQTNIEDLLDKLKANKTGDTRFIRVGFLKGATRLAKQIASANNISFDDIQLTDLLKYSTAEDDEILASPTLDEDAIRLYKVLADLSDKLKPKTEAEELKQGFRKRTQLTNIQVSDYDKSFIYFEEALRRGNYREFLSRLHKVKKTLPHVPTFEQEFVIFQAYSMVQAARDGKLYQPQEIVTSDGKTELSFYNSIFIDGRPGIGKSDVIMKYLVELMSYDDVDVAVSSKNDSVVDKVLTPKFKDKAKRLNELGFNAPKKGNLTASNSKVFDTNYIYPFLEGNNQNRKGLHEQGNVKRLQNVYIIDEATHLDSGLIEQMAAKDNAVFIFVGDTTQDGEKESLTTSDGKTVTEPFFQYTPGMERVPRITLSLRNSTENYNGNAAILETLIKDLYNSSPDELESKYSSYSTKDLNALNFTYRLDSDGKLGEGVMIVENPKEEWEKLRGLTNGTIAVVVDDITKQANYPGANVILSDQIQGQEFDYVIIDSIKFPKGDASYPEVAIEKARKLNTLLSRYRKGMVLPESIKEIYPKISAKQQDSISTIVVLNDEVVNELKEFSLSLTKDFSDSKENLEDEEKQKNKEGFNTTVDGFALFEEDPEDKEEPQSNPTSEIKNSSYLYISFGPETEYEGKEFILKKNNKILEGLSGRQQVIKDIRDLTYEQFVAAYGDLDIYLKTVPFKVSPTSKPVDSTQLFIGNQSLFTLPSKQFLTTEPNLEGTNKEKFDALKSLFKDASIFNRKDGHPIQENLKKVESDLNARGISQSKPIIMASSIEALYDLVYDSVLSVVPDTDSRFERVFEAVMKDMLGYQGKTIVFQSSDPVVKPIIDEFNQNFDKVEEFDNGQALLLKQYIKRTAHYHLNGKEPYNMSIGFVKRSTKSKIGDLVKSKIDNFKTNKQFDKTPRLSRSEMRRLGTLIYNYMREVDENDAINPMTDPLFLALTKWTLPGELIISTKNGEFIIEEENAKSALEVFFGFSYLGRGNFFEHIPIINVNEDGEEYVTFEVRPLSNKSQLPTKLKSYRQRGDEWLVDTSVTVYTNTIPLEFSVISSLAGMINMNTRQESSVYNQLVELKSKVDAKTITASKQLNELLNFFFNYDMEAGIDYYKVDETESNDYALRAVLNGKETVSFNAKGRYPVLQVSNSILASVFGKSNKVSVSKPKLVGESQPKKEPEESSKSKDNSKDSYNENKDQTSKDNKEQDEDDKPNTKSTTPEQQPNPNSNQNEEQSGEQQAPINSKPEVIVNEAPKPLTNLPLSKQMFESLMASGYEYDEDNNTYKVKKSEFLGDSLLKLIYGTGGELLVKYGIDFLQDKILRPIYYYDYETGKVLPDVYSPEGVESFNQTIDKLTKEKTMIIEHIVRAKESDDDFFIKIQAFRDFPRLTESEKQIIAQYLTLKNLHHLLNFEVYPDISDILRVEMTKEGDTINVKYIPRNRMINHTFSKESADVDALESGSAFIRTLIQRLPRLKFKIETDNEGNKQIKLSAYSYARASYKEVSKWLNELINESDDFVDANGNIDSKRLKEEFEKVKEGVSIRNQEGIVNLYALFFNEEDELEYELDDDGFPTSIYSLFQVIKNKENELANSMDVLKTMNELQTLYKVKAAFNIFSKQTWKTIAGVDETNPIESSKVTNDQKVQILKDQIVRESPKTLLIDIIKRNYGDVIADKLKSQRNTILKKHLSKDNPSPITNDYAIQIAKIVIKVLEEDNLLVPKTSVESVNGQKLPRVRPRNIMSILRPTVRKVFRKFNCK